MTDLDEEEIDAIVCGFEQYGRRANNLDLKLYGNNGVAELRTHDMKLVGEMFEFHADGRVITDRDRGDSSMPEAKQDFYWVHVAKGGNSDEDTPWQPAYRFLDAWYVCGSEMPCEPGDVVEVGPRIIREPNIASDIAAVSEAAALLADAVFDEMPVTSKAMRDLAMAVRRALSEHTNKDTPE